MLPRSRLTAEEGNVSELERAIEEVAKLGEKEARLARRLKTLSETFRMEELVGELAAADVDPSKPGNLPSTPLGGGAERRGHKEWGM